MYCTVITYRRGDRLAATLEAIARQTRTPDLLVVVDNSPSASTEQLVDAYRNHGLDVTYLPMAENTGPAGGTAAAMQHVLAIGADDDWLLRVDDDRPPDDPALFEDLERFAQRSLAEDPQTGGVGLVGARYDWNKGRLLRPGDHELVGPVHVDYLATNHLPLFRVGAIREAGVFRAELFFGSSEVEYGLRMRSFGFQLYAHGERWLALRPRRSDPEQPRFAVTEPNWRRYYSLRNQIFILRSAGYTRTALRISLLRGVAKPLANMVRSPRLAWANLRLNVRALHDGWRGRLGRTLTPDDPDYDR